MPSLILVALINAYPLAYAINAALHDGSLIQQGAFVGLGNFSTVLKDPAFWASTRFTAIFVVASVFGSWALGVVLAVVLQIRFPGRAVFRVLLLLPWIAPVVVTSMSWALLLGTSNGAVPSLFRALGLGNNVLFLGDPVLAQVTVCLFKIWISFPFTLIMMGSALESVDQNVYEAARIDGATRWQQFVRITLPVTARSTYVCWILMSIFTINDFPSVWLLTGGGPVGATQTMIVYAYNLAFSEFTPGLGIAVALLITVCLVAVSVFLYRMIRRSFTVA
ncbi:carbohydrate ABC transporter permease [Actinacidiphila oryziradicis]|uniref:carbohydrate ABC transporter permease n=1 Tax=Actinacidiphila oryziradicis TaxID=2571141 RepID=UPI001FEB258D|nr:sugar ABC transporter permease [Actinacidiphila oryziradicis]